MVNEQTIYELINNLPPGKIPLQRLCNVNADVEAQSTCLKISVMKLTLVLQLVSTLLTTSMSVSCSSSMEQSEDELGSLSVSVDVLEWLCSGSPPTAEPPDKPTPPPPGPDEHPLPSRWELEREPPPPLSSELPADRAARPAAARWRRKHSV